MILSRILFHKNLPFPNPFHLELDKKNFNYFQNFNFSSRYFHKMHKTNAFVHFITDIPANNVSIPLAHDLRNQLIPSN